MVDLGRKHAIIFFFLMNDLDSQLYFEELFLRRNKTLISMLQCISRLIHK